VSTSSEATPNGTASIVATDLKIRQAEPKTLIRTFIDRGAKLLKTLKLLVEQLPEDS
jgi:hypothetical protein